jgi:hypothetical protein
VVDGQPGIPGEIAHDPSDVWSDSNHFFNASPSSNEILRYCLRKTYSAVKVALE